MADSAKNTADGVEGFDPTAIPKRRLYSGAEIPAIGLGTFGSDKYSAQEVADAVVGAAGIGYRHFDCASVYGNEHVIGPALGKVMSRGVSREELWVTSKVWNDKHDAVAKSCEKSLRELGLDYLDLYLVHWPFPNCHAPGVGQDARDPHAVPYVHDRYMKTWRQMESLVERGLVRHIGTSNITVPKLRLILRDAKIKPAANEMEIHPHFQQKELFEFVTQNDIVPIGYSPLGSPSRPERDRTPEDTVDMDDPVILDIAGRLGVHPAVVCIKWAIQRGEVVIPFSVKPAQYSGNLRATVGEWLTEEEMTEIARIEKNNRLIKGQVFLWDGAKSWEDLWDEHGEIAK